VCDPSLIHSGAANESDNTNTRLHFYINLNRELIEKNENKKKRLEEVNDKLKNNEQAMTLNKKNKRITTELQNEKEVMEETKKTISKENEIEVHIFKNSDVSEQLVLSKEDIRKRMTILSHSRRRKFNGN
jgi:hypothetical protein